MPTQAHLHFATALAQLEAARDARFLTLFTHGTLQIELYAPRGDDPQKPHVQDEIYVIAQGSGTFFNGETRQPFTVGDLLFVPARVEHRFEDFTDDFATWVFFYGPAGGEQPAS